MSIEALKLALEALEEAHPKPYNESVISHVEAITALRTAIEQAEKQEPVAWAVFEGWNAHDLYLPQEYDEALKMAGYKGDHAEVKPLYTTPPAALVQPVQPVQPEPKHYRHTWGQDGERCVVCGDKDWMGTSCKKISAPAAPVQEPVAYVVWGENNVPALTFSKPADTYVFDALYYTAPPAAQPAPVQEPVAWKNAAIRLGEELSSVGPDGYYDMTAEQWLDWALEQQPRGKNSLTTPPAAQRQCVTFPTMLRKMWSGGEVQAWLDENVNKEKNT
jgi:hypothetical protein